MIDIQNHFKNSKDLSANELDQADITAEELIKIYYNYINSLRELETEGIYLSNKLQVCNNINSVRWRVKDPIHLLTKIVRKRKEAKENKDLSSKYLSINENNYKEIINDLIGLRAIYLFKFQWELVDDFICKNFKISHEEKVMIYHAPEDDLRFYYEDKYKKEINGRELEYSQQKKESKYRSTHYIVEANYPNEFKLEIQIRSILDEAWGEIDHFIRYPDHQNDEDLKRRMTILNGAINGCEELATNYVEYFQGNTREALALLNEASEPVEPVLVDADPASSEKVDVENSGLLKGALENEAPVKTTSFNEVLEDLARDSDMSRIITTAYPKNKALKSMIENQNMLKSMSDLNLNKGMLDSKALKNMIESQNMLKSMSDLNFNKGMLDSKALKSMIESQNMLKSMSDLNLNKGMLDSKALKSMIENQNMLKSMSDLSINKGILASTPLKDKPSKSKSVKKLKKDNYED